MNSSARRPDGFAWYEIRLKGHLSLRWTSRFDGMSLIALEDGTTVIAGAVPDQAALHGLLRTIGDLGLPLLSVAQAHPDSTSATSDPATSTRRST